MRIGIDGACLLGIRSGIPTVTTGLIRALGERKGIEIVLFFACFKRNPRRMSFDFGPARVKISFMRFPSRLLEVLWRRIPYPRVDWFTDPLDVFHSPNHRVLPVGKTPLVVTVHDLTILKFPDMHPPKRVAQISRWLHDLKRADAVIADSENTRRDILEYLDVRPEKVEVIYPAHDASLFHPRGPASRASRPYILYVGTLEPRKNIPRLLRAFRLLQARGYKEHTLVLAGAKGWMVENIFQELKRSDAVHLRGYVPDDELPALYRGADFLAYPSLYEGFGIPPLEAMACGTPVLTSGVSSLPEVVGDAAVLVDPLDEEAIADGMERLIRDSALRKRLVAQGLKQAARFTWKETASRTVKLYEQVVGQRPR